MLLHSYDKMMKIRLTVLKPPECAQLLVLQSDHEMAVTAHHSFKCDNDMYSLAVPCKLVQVYAAQLIPYNQMHC